MVSQAEYTQTGKSLEKLEEPHAVSEMKRGKGGIEHRNQQRGETRETCEEEERREKGKRDKKNL